MNKSNWFHDLFLKEAKAALSKKGSGGGSSSSGGGGVTVPMFTISYDTVGKPVNISYLTVNNNTVESALITSSTSGTIQILAHTRINIWTDPVQDFGGIDTYPIINNIESSIGDYLGMYSQYGDQSDILIQPSGDSHLTITVESDNPWG